MSDKVTARPWIYKSNGHYFDIGVENNDSVIPVYPMACIGVGHEQEANAAHIVKCVNYHERLVEALRELLEDADNVYTQGELIGGDELSASCFNVRKLLNELDT